MIATLRRNAVPLAVACAAILAVVLGFRVFARVETERMDATRRVLNAPSDIRLGLTIRHDAGAVEEESWEMRDRDGISTASYRIVGRDGETIRLLAQPRATTDVSFLFELAVQDGIWELPNRPPRGDVATHFAFSVYQLNDGAHGSHRFELTDPHYWATTGGHQFHIHLDPDKPVPNLLQLSSTTLVEPRYAKLVADFEAFGSPEFRAKVAQSRRRIAAGAKPAPHA